MSLLQRLFPALLIFSVLAGAGAGLHGWGQSMLQQARTEAQQSQQERQRAMVELNQLQDNLPQIKRDSEDYELAQMRGIWAAEDRLRFSEGLARLAQSHGLQSLEYGVAPREIFVAADPKEPAQGQWLRGSIEMQLGLLHEEQLLRFAEGFPYLLGGAPVLQECTVSLPQNPAENGGGNIVASCKGVLYSFLGAPRPMTKKPVPAQKGTGR